MVTVVNSGDFDTDEVVQLYMKDNCEFAVPKVSLCGFKRVHIRKGETLTVEIAVPKSAFEAVDNDGRRAVYGDRFTLFADVCLAGENSACCDILCD